MLTITEHNVPSDEAAKRSEQAWKHALGSLKDMLGRQLAAVCRLVIGGTMPRYADSSLEEA